MDRNDILAHFGVKGMHWGVRRTPEQLGYKKGKADNRSEDKKEVDSLRKRSSKTLSNKDLEKINKRMNLERTYADLKRRELSSGKQTVESILAYGTAAYALYKSPAGKAVKSMIENKLKK